MRAVLQVGPRSVRGHTNVMHVTWHTGHDGSCSALTGVVCSRILTELKELLEDPVVRARYEAAVPTWVQLMRLASTFEDPGLARVVAYRKEDDEEVVMGKKARARKASNAGASSNSSSRREEWIGSVRPDDFLGAAFTDFRRSSPGQQEDAHEFLVFFLDRLHDEIVTLQRSGGGGGGDSAPAKGAEASNGGAEEVEGEWQEIGEWSAGQG